VLGVSLYIAGVRIQLREVVIRAWGDKGCELFGPSEGEADL
jgi:hypothetical protein